MSGCPPLRPEPAAPDHPVARVLRWIALGAFILLALWQLGSVLLLVFASVLMAIVLVSASRFVARRTGISRRTALGGLVVLLFALAAYAAFIGATGIISRANMLAAHLTNELDALRAAVSTTPWGQEVLDRVQNYFANLQIAGVARGVATTTVWLVVTAVLLIGAAIYFAISPQMYVNGFVRLLPQQWRPRGRATLLAVGETLAWWFLGQLIDMATIGTLVFAGLYLLGAPLPATLAMLATLLNFVPYIGAICGAAPAILVALGRGPTMALEVACLFTVVQALEGNVVAPLVQRRTVRLPPVLTIFSQTVFGTLFGLLGLLLATPISAALLVAVRMIYVEDILGDHGKEDPVIRPE